MANNIHHLCKEGAVLQSIDQLLTQHAISAPDRILLVADHHHYNALALENVRRQLSALVWQRGIRAGDRVAICMPKSVEMVLAMLAISRLGAIFVPINPASVGAQIQHIVQDCQAKLLICDAIRQERYLTAARFRDAAQVVMRAAETWVLDLQPALQVALASAAPIPTVSDPTPSAAAPITSAVSSYPTTASPMTQSDAAAGTQLNVIDEDPQVAGIAPQLTDIAALLYTSGSTGKPKGVVLSQQNLLLGALSVSQYLALTAKDRILAVLPFSFDYGLNQLWSGWQVGACVVLLDYLLPQDVMRAVREQQITVLAAVPPLWSALVRLRWPTDAVAQLRVLTNSGGHVAPVLADSMAACFPHSDIYLMYGLTEAFRSTYLPPAERQRRPTSVGKAIPFADVLLLNAQGQPCAPYEHGELVHRGPLVAQGYWQAPELTAQRFRPDPMQPHATVPQLAVWSGDTFYQDEDGYLYFVSRRDDMIKTQGHRVSPTEIEQAVLALSTDIIDVAAIAVNAGPADSLLAGQTVIAVIYSASSEQSHALWLQQLRVQLPGYMLPRCFIALPALPKNGNGKIDRHALKQQYANVLLEGTPL
jgi:acyl-CoA synthetase (AMP-forming)/AMP-acid ligase II